MTDQRKQSVQAFLFFLILAGTAALYWPATGGGLHFDDRQSLDGLALIHDLPSAINFIFSGTAGPTGRPLALASFSLHAYAWPDHPEVFLQTNIFLHLINGALLAWCLIRLGRLRNTAEQQANWAAIATTALWLTIPLLASSSLLIVQRMATLSATFMLLGMLGYLTARAQLLNRPRYALAGMTVSLGGATLLAMLSKENGALLPALLLVVECTLLRGSLFTLSRLSRAWGLVCLTVPTLAILAFLASRVPYPESTALYRQFSAEQRLWTEAGILWQYLLHAFIPTQPSLTPFHDQLRASAFLQTSTLVAISTWLIVIGAAIQTRKRFPLLTFAVFWYLTAHLLESTVLNLELYFAHRNYLALIGPVYALCASVVAAPAHLSKLASGLLTGYTLVMAASLYNLTSLWGQPDLAAEMWATYKPDSVRANQHLAAQLHRDQWHGAAVRVLEEIYAKAPERNLVAGVQALTLACAMHPTEDRTLRIKELTQYAGSSRPHPDLPKNLLELQRLIGKEPCTGVSPERIEHLTLSALSNPAYSGSSFTRHNLHAVLIELAIARQDFGSTMTLIEESLRIKPTLEGLHLALSVLIDGGRPDLGQALIDKVRAGMPKHPIQRAEWRRQLESMERQITELNATPSPQQLQEAQ